MNKIYKNIVLMGLVLFSVSLGSTKTAGNYRIITGKSVSAFTVTVKPNGRTSIEEKCYSIKDDQPLKKRSHKRRRKVRRPREGR